jgi:hypothetical protein
MAPGDGRPLFRRTTMMLSRMTSRLAAVWMMIAVPALMGAEGKGCGGGDDEGGGTQITPDMTGEWSLSWADDLQVKITIGGAVYEETIGAQGGAITIDHNGQPLTFDLDCSRPAVVCPSEVWPSQVGFNQKDAAFPRNVYVKIPKSECSGSLVDPDPSECGAGTNNEECDQVCDGDVTVSEVEAFGRITIPNDELVVLLGGGIASNGVNCAMLGLSLARADIETTGSAADGDWKAVSLPSAEVITGYAGGCLWAGDPNDDGTLEAIVIGAGVELRTSFTGERL